jgi:hypothetical protein
MQRESVQIYLIPSRYLTITASRKVFGRLVIGMSFFLSFIQGGGLGRYQVRAALTATESNVLGTVVLVCDVKNQIDLLGVDAYDS